MDNQDGHSCCGCVDGAVNNGRQNIKKHTHTWYGANIKGDQQGENQANALYLRCTTVCICLQEKNLHDILLFQVVPRTHRARLKYRQEGRVHVVLKILGVPM